MTLLDIRNLLYYWVDDTQGIQTGSGGYFTPVQVNAFINNALLEVQKQLLQAGQDYYETPVQTITVVNQQDYVLPTDFYKIRRVELVTSGTGVNQVKKRLGKINLNQQSDGATRTGVPSRYWLGKNRISLDPIPNTVLPLNLYYSYRVPQLVLDTDTPDCPIEFQEYIACLAAKDCFIKDDRVLTNINEKIAAYRELLKQTSQDRNEDGPRMVNIVDDGWGDIL